MLEYWIWWWEAWFALWESCRMPARKERPKQDYSFIGYGF